MINSLDKANTIINEHKQKQMLKYSAQCSDITGGGSQMKKSTTAKKRSSLYASCIRPGFL